uniref:Uncharacterized protein n=1 Tax=Rhizophora mucronata TaxID=61149 RepID=A0A2P2QZH1_RHIMU
MAWTVHQISKIWKKDMPPPSKPKYNSRCLIWRLIRMASSARSSESVNYQCRRWCPVAQPVVLTFKVGQGMCAS